MKKLYYIIFLILSVSCNTENAPDCLQTTGDIITETFSVPSFSKIRIEDDVSLVIQQDDVQEVRIETGKNLFNDVNVSVVDETLVITNANRCNLVRSYATTTAFVTVPNLTLIRNSSAFNVVGEGVLRFPNLQLVSNTTGGIEGSKKSGDFTLTVDCEILVVEANGFSSFYIDGEAQEALISFEDEIPFFNGPNLLIDDLRIFHRSANRMIVNPQHRIEGKILGTGNVIAVNRPDEVVVEEIFTGRLIFQD